MLHRFFYRAASAATCPNHDDLEILRHALAFNESNGLTGLLIRHDGSFFQVLEGGPDVIYPLAERIEADPRTNAFQKLWCGRAEERLFGDWSMCYSPVADHDAALIDFLDGLTADSPLFVKIKAIRAMSRAAREHLNQDTPKGKRAAGAALF